MFGASSELAPNMFRASSEPASVMVFGFKRANFAPFLDQGLISGQLQGGRNPLTPKNINATKNEGNVKEVHP